MRYGGLAWVWVLLASGCAAAPSNDEASDPSSSPTRAALTAAAHPALPSVPVAQTPPSIGSYGTVRISSDLRTQVTDLVTTLTVPPVPLTKQFLYLWPGLQPQGDNYLPIGNGVLQPVLAWGGVCGPPQQPAAFSTWWVAGIYTNPKGQDPNHNGCYGGAAMRAETGDKLVMHMHLEASAWVQDITNLRSGETVSFTMDMGHQAQNHVYFVIESYGGQPEGDVVFSDTAITFATPTPGSCRAARRGPNDYVGQGYISPDGMHCAISEIILRTASVPVTEPSPGP